MKYLSTRGADLAFSAAQAITAGIAPDGGLFVPELIPEITKNKLNNFINLSYQELAAEILGMYLSDYTASELSDCIKEAYKVSEDGFDSPLAAPLIKAKNSDNIYVLELWHGPTSAFKDMALQLLPHLLTKALIKTDEKSQIVILVATSGDTGKAALEGFKNVEGAKIIVFYPEDGVSEIQKLQMISQEGTNLAVIAVKGNFDDAQTGVKNIFNDAAFNNKLAQNGYKLSSANSINWGRLAPQIVYYFSAYASLLKNKTIKNGEKINFAVPTGNFGNILALYYAKLMGLPVNRLICASNSNNVLTDFLNTGIYNRNRHFYKTYSPSMDILISSNLERLLYHVTGGDSDKVRGWMNDLKNKGRYQIGSEYLRIIKDVFYAGWADDERTVSSLKNIHNRYNYTADPHTAVAWLAAEEYIGKTGDDSPLVIASTASPYKFSETVLKALLCTDDYSAKSEFEMLYKLSEISNLPIPPALAKLEKQKILHAQVCSKEKMPDKVCQTLETL